MTAELRLAGRRAVVTGAASGIGRASALLFAREGASVVCLDRDEGVKETAAAIEAKGGTAKAIVGDVGDEAVVAGAVAEAGEIDVMFANAGTTGRLEPILDLTVDDWLGVLRVNLIGVFACLKHAALSMRARGRGSIVCTASVAALGAGAGPAHYSASKAAVVNLVRAAASQLGGSGVRVNAIAPGLIETGMTRPAFDQARAAGKLDRIGQLNPLRRAGAPEEIAECALFLASDASRYVNGQLLVADGGLSSSLPFVPGRLY
jgi:NAD(P)-dependent dehydrogenase (short-subunit alcohol dehydrogenase family)